MRPLKRFLEPFAPSPPPALRERQLNGERRIRASKELNQKGNGKASLPEEVASGEPSSKLWDVAFTLPRSIGASPASRPDGERVTGTAGKDTGSAGAACEDRWRRERTDGGHVVEEGSTVTEAASSAAAVANRRRRHHHHLQRGGNDVDGVDDGGAWRPK